MVARHRRLLAGAVSFDAPTDLARRYRDFPRIPGGQHLQELARREVGGTPGSYPGAYARRSPIAHVRAIAFSQRAAAALLEHCGRGGARPGAPLGASLPAA